MKLRLIKTALVLALAAVAGSAPAQGPGAERSTAAGGAEFYEDAIIGYREKLNASTDIDERRAYADTLMSVYNDYVENFRDTGRENPYLTEARAVEYMNLMSDDKETVRKLLKEAVDADKKGSNTPLMVIYFGVLTDDYKLFRSLSADEYLAEYESLGKKFEKAQSKTKEGDMEIFESLAVRSGALERENPETASVQ
jgi:hypothetical protein